MEFLKITPEEDLTPQGPPSNGQLGLWDSLEPQLRTGPIEVNLAIDLEPDSALWHLWTFLIGWGCLFLLISVLAILYIGSGYIEHRNALVALEAENKPPKPIFLYLPPDLEKKLQEKPKTPTLSDKDRLARGKAPVIVPRAPEVPYSKGNTQLPEVAGGKPKVAAPPSPPPQPRAQPKSEQGQEEAKAAPKPPDDGLKLEDVPKPPSSPGHLALSTPEEAIQQSLQDAQRASRAQGRAPGPGDSLGQFSNPNSNFSVEGPMILSDTQGVDFGPYLARIVAVVRQNWYALMPESARLGQKGRVALQFAIQKDGRVLEVDPVVSSGSNALDGAAKAAIDLSIPFPPLPEEFKGNDLKLRFIFLYNLGYGPQ